MWNSSCGWWRPQRSGILVLIPNMIILMLIRLSKAGRLAEFDMLANKFFVASGKARDAIYKEALTLAKKAGVASKHYVRVMEKLANGTEDYIEKESKR